MAEIKVYSKDLVTNNSRCGRNVVGIVDQVGSIDSDSDSDFENDAPLENGMIRVTWYPRGFSETLSENKVTVIDRCCLPRDVVRMKNGNQLGTVTNLEVFANFMPLGTRKSLKNISLGKCKQFLPFVEQDVVVLNNWYGRVFDFTGYYVLKFLNNSRYSFPFECEGADGFEEIYPNISDVGGFCHEIYTLYPGQHLASFGSFLSESEWLCGPTINFKKRMRYSFMVEKIELTSVTVKWLSALPPGTENDKQKPCDVVVGDDLKKIRALNKFWSGHVYVGDRLQYKITKSDADYLNCQKEVRYERPHRKRRKRKCRRVNSHSNSVLSHVEGERRIADNKQLESNEASANVPVDEVSEESASADENEDVAEEQDSEMGEREHTATGTNTLNIAVKGEDNQSLKYKSQIFDYVLALQFSGKYNMYAMINKATNNLNIFLAENNPLPEGFFSNLPVPNPRGVDIYDYFTNLLTMFVSYKDKSSILKECSEFQYWMKLKDKYIKGTYNCDNMKTEETERVINSGHPLHHDMFENISHKILCAFVSIKPLDSEDLEQATFQGSALKNKTSQTETKFVGRSPKYKESYVLSVEVTKTASFVDIQWQDGTISKHVSSVDVCAAHHVDQNDFCPGDFVIDKRIHGTNRTASKNYGLVIIANSSTRMVDVKWFQNEFPQEPIETLSAYDLADHPLFGFRISDIICNNKKPENAGIQIIGEMTGTTNDGLLEVQWCDGIIGTVQPQDVTSYVPDEDSDDSEIDLDDSDSSNDSWESINSEEENFTSFTEYGTATDQSTTNFNSDDQSSQTVVSDINDNNEDLEPNESEVDENGLYSDFKFIDDDLTSPEEEASGKKVIKRGNTQLGTSDNEIASRTQENSQQGEENTQVEYLPEVYASHQFYSEKLQIPDQRSFIKAVNRDMNLIKTSKSLGIRVKLYEDCLHLMSVMINGPQHTPYEHGLFFFDVLFPSHYPQKPPTVHYVSYSPRLNPNLYENGTVCVSLLGTWRGKGNEIWTKESNILQVLLSIQGLILNAEPYYNEAGYEGHRGTAEGSRNSRSYNEMVLLRMVQHSARMLHNPPKPFETETMAYCKEHIPLFIKFVSEVTNITLDQEEDMQVEDMQKTLQFPLLPISRGCLESLNGKLKELKAVAQKKLHLDV